MKYINKTLFISILLLTTVSLSSIALAQGPLPSVSPVMDPAAMPEQQTQRDSPVEKVSAGTFRIGDILLNRKEKSITFPAQVNMDRGLLEYVIVSTGGKTHESLFRTKVRPYDLQLAFLLLGFEGTDRPLAFQGAPEKPVGEPVEIFVEYKAGNSNKTIHTEDWITQEAGGIRKDVGRLDWVFTGSVIIDGQFLAQSEGSIAAVYHDPVSLVNNASRGGESDEIWFVKEGPVPPVGTPVTITFRSGK